jgi:uncharacterized membrane protein YcaP (DUF421 family)
MEIVGQGSSLGWVALKAALLFLTAVAGFRLSGRRTLAELSAFDFVAAVAVGAVIGRVPNSTTTSYVQGAVTLVTVLVLHNVVTRLRFLPRIALLVDHPPRLLVRDGQIQDRWLRRCGLTRDDLFGLLRQQGVVDLAEVRYVIFEQRGRVSVVLRSASPDGGLLSTEILGTALAQRPT